MKNSITLIFRMIVGFLFIFSGLVKLNDPVGTAIKLQEYFEVFSHDISPFFEVFIPASLTFSVILSVMEVVLGVAAIINWKMKLTSSVLLGLIVFFTFLTFYSAYFNKVTDCGCFGDAIKLTPWESFTKDIILLVLIIYIFIFKKEEDLKMKKSHLNLLMSVSTLVSLFIAITAIRHLPFIDFRPYKVGVNIAKAMQPSEPLKYQYVMNKDGKEEIFETYPTDPSYKFVRMDIVNPEAQPKITDYSVWNDEGDFTEETFKGKKLLIVMHNVNKASSDFSQINKLIADCVSNGVATMILTGSDGNNYEKFSKKVNLIAPYYYADATVLKTMIRSNPGIVLMNEGTVMGKWHFNDTPEIQKIKSLLK